MNRVTLGTVSFDGAFLTLMGIYNKLHALKHLWSALELSLPYEKYNVNVNSIL